MYYKTVNNIFQVEQLILPITIVPFCLLTLFALVYYIRRRYKLYREIKRIPQELLFKESYKNYLKNLKIKCIIHNFIIVILVLEFVQNIGEVIFIIPNWIQETNSKIISIFPFLFTFLNYSDMFFFSMRFSVVPVVSLVMNFLWLVYRKYKYKYMVPQVNTSINIWYPK